MLYVILWIRMILLTVGIISQSLGVTVILLYEKSTNQSMLLVNLCIAMILTILREVVFNVLALIDPYGGNCAKFCRSAGVGSQFMVGNLIILLMILLNTNRLVYTLSPLKYKVYMPKTRTKKLIMACYMLSVISVVVYAVAPYTYFVLTVMFISIAVLLVASSIITYLIIFYKIKLSTRTFHNEMNRPSQRKNIVKSYLVPCFIVFTFLLMYGVPWLTIQFYAKHQEGRSRYVTIFALCSVMAVGYVIDPVVYIFLAKTYRRILLKYISRRIGQHETSSGDSSTSVAHITTTV